MSALPDPVSAAMWADFDRAQELRQVQVRPLVGFAISPAAAVELLVALGMLECLCRRCLAARHARAGCDGCSDLGTLCPDHDGTRSC